MATVGSAIVANMEAAFFAIVCDCLRSTICDRLRLSAIIWKPEIEHGTKMTEIAEINEPHSTEIANPENQTEKIQYLSCPKPETIFLPVSGQQR